MKYDGLMFLGSLHSDIISAYNIVISVIRWRLYCHFQRTAHIYSEGKIIRCLLSKVYGGILKEKLQ